MRVVHDQVFGLNPNFLMQYRPPMRVMPSVLNISGDCVVGNSGGVGLDLVKSAYGEYAERFHFYNEVQIDMTARLHEVNHAQDAERVLYAVKQMQQTKQDATTYPFDITQVRNIFSQEAAYLPTTLLTLSQGDSLDRQFIPFIDSCGQAVHATQSQSFQCALNEFIERQGLVGAWLSGLAAYQIEMDPKAKVNEIYALLTQHGRLVAYDVSQYLPGYSVIIFYFSHSNKDSVKYSVGMASDFSPRRAFYRALNELWQSYIFIYLNADKPENLDDRYQYLNQLLSFNHHDTENRIPFHKQGIPVVSLATYFTLQPYYLAEALQQIKSLSSWVYAYEGRVAMFGRQLHYCKVLSPDFFLHMGVMKPLNFDNVLANKLGIKVESPITQPIPFP